MKSNKKVTKATKQKQLKYYIGYKIIIMIKQAYYNYFYQSTDF